MILTGWFKVDTIVFVRQKNAFQDRKNSQMRSDINSVLILYSRHANSNAGFNFDFDKSDGTSAGQTFCGLVAVNKFRSNYS